jgi:hypothetical protein
VMEATSSWTYGTATIRPLNNSTTNRASFVHGFEPSAAYAILIEDISYTNVTAGSAGIGLDSTTAFSGSYLENAGSSSSQATSTAFNTTAAIGWHYFQACEIARAGTVTLYGTTFGQNGLALDWWG